MGCFRPTNPDLVLSGGDRRSIGGVDQVIKQMHADPAYVRLVVGCLLDDGKVVRMRAADALEKFSRTHSEALDRYADFFLNDVADLPQQEIRWHMAQMLPRLSLNKAQKRRAVELFERYLEDRSSIVRTWALNGLAEISQGDASLKRRVGRILTEALKSGTPAMKARARSVLRRSCARGEENGARPQDYRAWKELND